MPNQTVPESEQNLLVEIKDLRTYFHLAEGLVRAVDGVNLKIHRRETLGIVGESGCGKSISAFSMLRYFRHLINTLITSLSVRKETTLGLTLSAKHGILYFV